MLSVRNRRPCCCCFLATIRLLLTSTSRNVLKASNEFVSFVNPLAYTTTHLACRERDFLFSFHKIIFFVSLALKISRLLVFTAGIRAIGAGVCGAMHKPTAAQPAFSTHTRVYTEHSIEPVYKGRTNETLDKMVRALCVFVHETTLHTRLMNCCVQLYLYAKRGQPC